MVVIPLEADSLRVVMHKQSPDPAWVAVHWVARLDHMESCQHLRRKPPIFLLTASCFWLFPSETLQRKLFQATCRWPESSGYMRGEQAAPSNPHCSTNVICQVGKQAPRVARVGSIPIGRLDWLDCESEIALIVSISPSTAGELGVSLPRSSPRSL